ncbi:hypothetical protein E1B28_012357 [Marasmius oreades]|uniref:Uncharacterized protein n=1 Tax=Marasmius oreades TaxID=181124 RepID=A0A9P7UNL7_9AGAR|nr:uncharacterized protein E1B28_012357 [Marasmius oreades]KAG7088353.1 hypothetical protein E1B28_012357 [Marasmius oreades]
MGHALSCLIYHALVDFFTLNWRRQTAQDSASPEIDAKDLGQPLNLGSESNTSTWNTENDRCLHDLKVNRTKSRRFPWGNEVEKLYPQAYKVGSLISSFKTGALFF